MAKFSGKTALITGGSTGIGLATAKLLVQEGARVVVTGRSAGALAAASEELGPNAIAVASDTSNLAAIDELVERVRAELGSVDLLFVNAGIGRFVGFDQATESHYDEILNTNTKGAYFTAQKFLPLLKSGGAVVFNTSVADELGMATTSVYSASKAALRSFTRTLATELLPRGIRVNAVMPGPITTPIYQKLGLPAEAVDAFAEQLRQNNPMKRFGSAEEVGKAVLFLAFDATYTTGAELPVDGGLTQV
jgi:NAD(P)-dependent dehydrogenase (short-subunit alcohol dehydrogenase family)